MDCWYHEKMKKIIVGSKNPVKIEASLAGFKKMFKEVEFEIVGISVESGVSEQPSSDKETFKGAYRRALNTKKASSDGDYFVGIEGGVEQNGSEMESFAWLVIISKDGKIGKGKTGTFILPTKVAELINTGMELGEADDIVFNKNNSKQQNGAVGILTNDVITRTTFYTEAIVYALIPFKYPQYY